MEFADYIKLIRQHWRQVTIITLASMLAAITYTLVAVPQYESQSKLFVSTQTAANATDLQQGSAFTENRMASYVQLATTPIVLNSVIKDLRLRTTATKLSTSITASNPTNTTFVVIQAQGASPRAVAQLANATARALASRIEELETPAGASASPVRVSEVEQATPSTRPTSPRIALNLAVGLLVGLVLGVAFAIIRHLLDTTVKEASDLDDLGDIPLLGIIPNDPRAKRQPLLLGASAHGHTAEAFRSLRTNVGFLGSDRHTSILVTSGRPNEGKTTTAVNLALALADAGNSVVLVDADLRLPSVAEHLGLDDSVGLSGLLRGSTTIDEALQQWGDRTLSVVPSGVKPPNPSELLQSRLVMPLLDTLAVRFDYTIIDTPPVLAVTDAALLAARADATVVTIRVGRTSKADLLETMRVLERAGTQGPGVVLTMTPLVRKSTYARDDRYIYYGAGDD